MAVAETVELAIGSVGSTSAPLIEEVGIREELELTVGAAEVMLRDG